MQFKSTSILSLFVTLILALSCQKAQENPNPAPPLLEFRVTGDALPLTVLNTNERGVQDSTVVTSLPYIVKLASVTVDNIVFRVYKQRSAGTVSVETLYKGQSIRKATTLLNRGRLLIIANSKSGTLTSEETQPEEWDCSKYEDRQLRTGPRGGCYYINSNRNKTYVDRSYCNCD